MTSATATMARVMATNARALHAGARPTLECPLRGVDPVLSGPRTVMDAPSSFFYSARLPSPVVRGADVAVLLACATILLTS
jgi:hypothetical protein